jgi:hypothetical protein
MKKLRLIAFAAGMMFAAGAYAAAGVQPDMWSAPTQAKPGLVGKDGSGNLSPGVTLFDENGVPLGTNANPLVSATSSAASQAYTATGCPSASPGCTSFTVSSSTAHAANDVVGAAAGALTFAGICPAAGREIIFTSTRLRYDLATVPAGMTSFRLYLYNVTPPSALADDAPWDLPSGDRASFLGYLDLGSPVDLGSTLYVETNGNQKQVTCASANVFGYLVTNGAYTTVNTDVIALVVKSVAP